MSLSSFHPIKRPTKGGSDEDPLLNHIFHLWQTDKIFFFLSEERIRYIMEFHALMKLTAIAIPSTFNGIH